MIRSVADVVVFLTPFESPAEAKEKIRKSREMFDAYALGSWLGLGLSESREGKYVTRSYRDAGWSVELVFSYREDLPPEDRFPAAFANFRLSGAAFPKDAVEAFVNDGIGFLTGVFGSECFVDADASYALAEHRSGKSPDLSNLDSFDLSDPSSKRNKDVLDILCYLRFSLLKHALGIESTATDAGKLLSEIPSGTGLAENLEFFRTRAGMTRANLVDRATDLDVRITQFLSLIS